MLRGPAAPLWDALSDVACAAFFVLHLMLSVTPSEPHADHTGAPQATSNRNRHEMC